MQILETIIIITMSAKKFKMFIVYLLVVCTPSQYGIITSIYSNNWYLQANFKDFFKKEIPHRLTNGQKTWGQTDYSLSS